MEYIVGYTGFVGSNIVANHEFDGKFNTKNIQDAFGGNPDLLVYSGVRAEMFLANQNPEADLALMDEAIDNIRKINPQKLVLISSIAVYQDPDGVDEDFTIDASGLTAYGANRLYLERWVQEHVEDHLIVRLPGLYGRNLKKNFLYDFINYIPPMLNQAKYEELTEREAGELQSNLIREHYLLQENGFYKWDKLLHRELKEVFRALGFSALHFTDSRGVYQYYNLDCLWADIELAMEHGIKLLNLAVEPVTAAEVYEYLTGEAFENELPKAVPYFNYKTKYAKLWENEQNHDVIARGYIASKEQVLKSIKKYVEEQLPCQ